MIQYDHKFRYWTCRYWLCCDKEWQLLLGKNWQNRYQWQPKCNHLEYNLLMKEPESIIVQDDTDSMITMMAQLSTLGKSDIFEIAISFMAEHFTNDNPVLIKMIETAVNKKTFIQKAQDIIENTRESKNVKSKTGNTFDEDIPK